MNKPINTRRLLFISGMTACLLFALLLVLTGTQTRGLTPQPPQAQEESATQATQGTAEKSSPAESKPAAPYVLSNAPADRELQRKIDRAIEESATNRARWGIFVMSVSDGRVLYARDAGLPFIPASNMKLYPTAVALDLLGADYRWRTSVYAATAPDKDGVIEGDLTLYGRGAPDLDNTKENSSLGKLADELYRRGVRRVRGRVIGDESHFRGEPLGDGWLWNDVQWYFGAEVSALTIGGNEVKLSITPAAKTGEPATLRLEPDTDYVRLQNETQTIERGKPSTIGINRGLSDNILRVWGDYPLGTSGFRARLSVHNPALWAARLFRQALRERGITVEGEAESKDARSLRETEKLDTTRAVELAFLTSKPLGEIARETNKKSLNLEAELILRTLGKERGATAPDTDPRKMLTRGDDEAGLAVIRLWLERAGASTNQLALHDGSGLSRLDLVTPEATARLLTGMTKSPAAEAFRSTLPIAGRDGTLSGRLRSAAGRIYAKTGLLTYTNSLSGYALTDKGELLAFSIICNNETTAASSLPTIDAIALLLTQNHQR